MEKKIDPIVERELVDFVQDLIRINTVNPPGNEAEAARHIADRLGREGMDMEIQEVAPGRSNVLAWLGGRSDRPALMLNGHLDTVPLGEIDSWNTDPFKGAVKDGRIYGRGTSDNKAGVGSIFMAALAVHRTRRKLPAPVVVAGVMGEETGGLGTTALLDRGIRPRQVIMAEWSSASTIALGYRGRLEVKVETMGRTAHASRPRSGVNAVEHMITRVLPSMTRYIEALPFTPNPLFLIDGSTSTITVIHGGLTSNIVPDRCESQLDVRIPLGQEPDRVERELRNLAHQIQKDVPGLRIATTFGRPIHPFFTPPETPLVSQLGDSIREMVHRDPSFIGKTGYCDGNIVAHQLQVPVVAYGPGNDSGHSPDEFVEVQDLVDCTRVLASAIVKLAQRGGKLREATPAGSTAL